MCKRMVFVIVCLFFFQINAGQENWYVGQVVFKGNNFLDRKSLLDHMQQKPSGHGHKVIYSFSQLAGDVITLETLYRKSGFLKAQVNIGNISRDSVKHKVAIVLGVNEGPRFNVSRICFSGEYFFPLDSICSFIPLKSGKSFDSSLYAASAFVIKDSLADHAFLLADVKSRCEADFEKNSISVWYDIRKGPVVLAGDPVIAGLKKTKPIVVKRELRFKKGEPLTSQLKNRTQKALYGTGIFSFIGIEPVDTLQNKTGKDTVELPVLLQLVEGNLFNISANAGYDQYEGFYGSAETLFRNLFGLGHEVSLLATLSQVAWNVQANYFYPYFAGSPLAANLNAYVERRYQQAFTGLFDGGEFALNGLLGNKGSFRIWTDYERLEWIHYHVPPNQISQPPPNNTLLLGSGITYDTRRTQFNPGKAIYGYFDAEIAGPEHISYQLYRVRADVRGYLPFANDFLSISSAAFVGYINGFGSDYGEVPIQQRFFVGLNGVRQIRGYNDSEVEPVDSAGVPIGGRFALILNVFEFRFPIFWLLNGTVFTDAGYISPSFSSFRFSKIRWSAGPGILLDLPVGLIRLDYGIELERREFEGRFVFNIGLPF
jgi:outer membrane protein insertion porin family